MKKRKMKTKPRLPEQIGVSQLKTHCLEIVERTHGEGQEYIITKHGEPVARLLPIGSGRKSPRGAWKGLLNVKGDMVHLDWSGEFEVTRK